MYLHSKMGKIIVALIMFRLWHTLLPELAFQLADLSWLDQGAGVTIFDKQRRGNVFQCSSVASFMKTILWLMGSIQYLQQPKYKVVFKPVICEWSCTIWSYFFFFEPFAVKGDMTYSLVLNTWHFLNTRNGKSKKKNISRTAKWCL